MMGTAAEVQVGPGQDVGLRRAILESFSGLDGAVTIASRSTPWASATFEGESHTLWLRFDGPGAVDVVDRFLLDLPEREFQIPDRIVADIALLSDERQNDQIHLVLDALTVTAD